MSFNNEVYFSENITPRRPHLLRHPFPGGVSRHHYSLSESWCCENCHPRFGVWLAACAARFASCSNDSIPEPPAPQASADATAANPVAQLLRAAFYETYPSGITGNKISVSSDAIMLEFYGWYELLLRMATRSWRTTILI